MCALAFDFCWPFVSHLLQLRRRSMPAAATGQAASASKTHSFVGQTLSIAFDCNLLGMHALPLMFLNGI